MSINTLLVITNVIVSLIALNNRDVFFKLDFQPYMIERKNEWFRFVSHAFVHADYMHLGVNMYVLYFFGDAVLQGFSSIAGSKGLLFYVLLYLGGILFSTIPGYARNRNNYNYHGVGASGAVSAIVYSFIVMAPFAPMGILFIPFRIDAWIFGILYFVLEIYLDRNRNSNIAHSAHYFGAAFGVIMTIILHPDFILRYFE